MLAAVPDEESVWRSAVFPIAFKTKQKQLSPKSFFKLWPADEGPFVLEMSLARQRCAPTLPMVHGFGCRLAASQNQNQADRGKPTDRVYCGAYELQAGSIRSLQSTHNLAQVKEVQVLHCIENGEFAHINLRIKVDTNGDEDAIEPLKTLIIDRLWHQSAGPAKHICGCDEAVQPHPSDWLQESPRGAYTDQRSSIRVAFDVTAYALFHFPRLWFQEAIKKLWEGWAAPPPK